MTQAVTLTFNEKQQEGPMMKYVIGLLPSNDDLLSWNSVADDNSTPVHQIDILLTDTVPQETIDLIEALDNTSNTGRLYVSTPRAAKNERVTVTWEPVNPLNNTITVTIAEIEVTFTDNYAFKCSDVGEYVIVPLSALADTVSVDVVERKNLNWSPD